MKKNQCINSKSLVNTKQAKYKDEATRANEDKYKKGSCFMNKRHLQSFQIFRYILIFKAFSLYKNLFL